MFNKKILPLSLGILIRRGAFRRMLSWFMGWRFNGSMRPGRILFGSFGVAGFALIPFMGHKSVSGHSTYESTKLERFKQEADTLYDVYLIENAFNVLRRFSSCNDPQVLWRLARILCEKAKLSKDKDDRRRFMYDALEMARRALDNEGDEGCWEAHKWYFITDVVELKKYAIILSYVSEYEGIRGKVRQSFEIKRHLEKALDINATDPTTWHALGVWYFTFADLPLWKTVIIKKFFGSIPSATYEDALKCFEKAEYLKPNSHSSNLCYLAEVSSKFGQKKEAFDYYKAAFKMPVITMDDGDAHEKAYEKLRKLGVKDFTKL